MTTRPRPILYSFRRCPYAMRARMAVWISGAEVELREVVLRDKPAEMLAASPKGTVPVLELPDAGALDESLDVMTWALDQADPDDWKGGDSDLSAALIAQNDGVFKHHLDRYKYPNRYENCDGAAHRAAGLEILNGLDNQIAANGNLIDSAVRFADVAVFPFVRQFANTDRAWFDTQALPALQTWLERCLTSEAFTAIMTKYPQWKQGDAPLVFSRHMDNNAPPAPKQTTVGV